MFIEIKENVIINRDKIEMIEVAETDGAWYACILLENKPLNTLSFDTRDVLIKWLAQRGLVNHLLDN